MLNSTKLTVPGPQARSERRAGDAPRSELFAWQILLKHIEVEFGELKPVHSTRSRIKTLTTCSGPELKMLFLLKCYVIIFSISGNQYVTGNDLMHAPGYRLFFPSWGVFACCC